jgi:hypothetical protein
LKRSAMSSLKPNRAAFSTLFSSFSSARFPIPFADFSWRSFDLRSPLRNALELTKLKSGGIHVIKDWLELIELKSGQIQDSGECCLRIETNHIAIMNQSLVGFTLELENSMFASCK